VAGQLPIMLMVNGINNNKKYMSKCNAAGGGGAYFLGFLGAAVYYVQLADSFWPGVVGVLKAIVWPAFLVYHLLGL